MKFTIHTIKDKVQERFNISDEHYYEILEGYFNFIRSKMESLDQLEVDNPLGTFVLRDSVLEKGVKELNSYFRKPTVRARKTLINQLSILLKMDKSYIETLSDEELLELESKGREKIRLLREQLHHIFTHKKLTKNGKNNIE